MYSCIESIVRVHVLLWYCGGHACVLHVTTLSVEVKTLEIHIHTELKVSSFCISWQVTSWGIPSMWLLASRHLTSNSLSLLMLWVDTAHVSLYLYMYMYVYISTSISWVVMQSYRYCSFFVYWCASLWCRHCIRSRSIILFLCPGVFMYMYIIIHNG